MTNFYLLKLKENELQYFKENVPKSNAEEIKECKNVTHAKRDSVSLLQH